MTAKDIQRLLIANRYRESFTVPNYTPQGWFESDVFEITPAGYFVEYEIKISLSDFKQDVKKKKEHIRYNRAEKKLETFTLDSKHGMLSKSSPLAPSRFWYVCPENLIKPEILPAWAGLIYVSRWTHQGIAGLVEHEKVKAPKIHTETISEEIKTHARGVCYWRMNSIFLRENCECDQVAIMTGCKHVAIESKMSKAGMVQFICKKCQKVLKEQSPEKTYPSYDFKKTV